MFLCERELWEPCGVMWSWLWSSVQGNQWWKISVHSLQGQLCEKILPGGHKQLISVIYCLVLGQYLYYFELKGIYGCTTAANFLRMNLYYCLYHVSVCQSFKTLVQICNVDLLLSQMFNFIITKVNPLVLHMLLFYFCYNKCLDYMADLDDTSCENVCKIHIRLQSSQLWFFNKCFWQMQICWGERCTLSLMVE